MSGGADKGKFKDFKDLLRARGGEPEPENPDDRGWTLETAAGKGTGADQGEGDTARDRILARPAAFGPMTEGPAVYGDIQSEEMTLLASFRVRTVFPDDVHEEVDKLPEDPDPANFEGRVDLRGEVIFTIDGADAKDYDDAIGITELPNGNVELAVHIADVGHYVQPGTALDSEALARGTSVYLADQVVPMLPEKISNHLCSLVPDRDRLAYSVTMEFDADGKRVAARVHKSVIRSVFRNTYRVVQDLLDGKDTDETREIAFLEGPLKLFQRWTLQQQKIRDARGSLRMQSPQRKFVFDEDHRVTAIVDSPMYFSQTLIEETALAANQAVGDLFRERGLPTIYRVHPEKDPEEIEAVAAMLLEHGIRVPNKERLTGRDIGRMIRIARRKQNSEALTQRIMGLIERAVYEVKDHEDLAKHFGLAREAYLHFTSPIRRYPDLVVHRWLHAIESRGEEAEAQLRTADLLQDLNEKATHSSLQAEVAEMAEQAVGDLKTCQLIEPHIGELHEAKIIRVSNYGLEVRLPKFNISAFLPARAIGEHPKLKGPTLQLSAGKRLFSFTEGYSIRIRIKDVDFLKLQIMLELADQRST
ncbi:MAG: ribonuclease R [Planctomycetota bacterium]|jgi:ribonuclease R|nr:ribonuclease R [Planctomycetota bacterium]